MITAPPDTVEARMTNLVLQRFRPPDEVEAAARALRLRDGWSGELGQARPEQIAPEGKWRTWLVMAGRGWGKTRTGAEWVRHQVQYEGKRRVALVGQTASDVRDVMVEGESGLLAVCEAAGFGAEYFPGKRRVVFENGAIATTYSAEKPRQLRGPQHDSAWADEIAQWQYPDAWDQLQFGLRLGEDPRAVATTTPRPIRLVRDLLERIPHGETVLTKGTSYDNRENLAADFFDAIIRRYEGTSLGRQELLGELLEDIEGAFWSMDMIDPHRVGLGPDLLPMVPELVRVVVAVDPATTHGDDSDWTGLAVAGVARNGDVYVLHISAQKTSPQTWASRAIALYDEFGADEVVYESNQGGDLVRDAIRAAGGRRDIRISSVHAKVGKRIRAEPVVMLYEQGRAHHVGSFAAAEEQMCQFPVVHDHDDMVDALVHAVTGARKRRRGRVRTH